MPNYFAQKIAHQDTLTSDLIIENGDPVVIYDIYVSSVGSGGPIITVREKDNSTIILEFELTARRDAYFDIPFMADKGVRLSASSEQSNISVSVKYRPGV